MTSSANSGLPLYERQRNARIAGNQAHLAALGLGGGLTGSAGRAPRARPAVNYSEQDAAARARADARAARADADAAERERKRQEKLAAREAKDAEKALRDAERESKRLAKLAAAAERAAAKVEAANQKDAKLAKFAADSALVEINDAAAPDMSVLSQREDKAFRAGFLAHAVLRYPGQPGSNGERYVIEVDAGAEIKRPRRPVTG